MVSQGVLLPLPLPRETPGGLLLLQALARQALWPVFPGIEQENPSLPNGLPCEILPRDKIRE